MKAFQRLKFKMAQLAQQESTWLDRHLFEEAENNFHSHVAKGTIKDYKPFNSHHRPRYQSHKVSYLSVFLV